jgi:hypothetical protein
MPLLIKKSLLIVSIFLLSGSAELFAVSVCDLWAGKLREITVNTDLDYYDLNGKKVQKRFRNQGSYIAVTGASTTFPDQSGACSAIITDTTGKHNQPVTLMMDLKTTTALRDPNLNAPIAMLGNMNGQEMLKSPTPCPTAGSGFPILPILASLIPDEKKEDEDKEDDDDISAVDYGEDVIDWETKEDKLISSGNENRPAEQVELNDDTGAVGGNSPYDIHMNNRAGLLHLSRRSCLAAMNNQAGQIFKKSSWSKISPEDMPAHLYNEAKGIYADLKSKNVKLRSHVSPEVVACIMMYENRGILNPFRVNPTYCNQKMTSTAVGLGQIVQSTLGDAFDRAEYPIVTDEAKRVFAGKSSIGSKQRALSSSPRLQIESVFHIFNLKNRDAIAKKKGRGSVSMAYVVALYDQDGKEKYVKKVSRCVGDIKTKSTQDVYKDLQKE